MKVEDSPEFEEILKQFMRVITEDANIFTAIFIEDKVLKELGLERSSGRPVKMPTVASILDGLK